jgi:hypothetical protein
MKNMTLLGSLIFALISVPALGSTVEAQGGISYRNDVFPILHAGRQRL